MPVDPGRRAALALVASALAGCAGGGREPATMADDTPLAGDAPQRGALDLTSPAFDDGDAIPREYGRRERDVNPPLAIAGVPDDAASLALVLDDPDAVEPAGQVWLHWLVWNVDPGRTAIPEAWDAAGAVEGTNDFGEVGYGGPSPPDREHTYRFKLYALDARLDAGAGADLAAVGGAAAGHVVASTQLEGTYAP